MKVKNPYYLDTIEEPEFFEIQEEIMNKALQDVADERKRQIEKEGWSQEHDDRHSKGELAKAAGCYANGNPTGWPWSLTWWKPSKDRRRNLVKAGALILAEIERLDREAKHESNG